MGVSQAQAGVARIELGRGVAISDLAESGFEAVHGRRPSAISQLEP